MFNRFILRIKTSVTSLAEKTNLKKTFLKIVGLVASLLVLLCLIISPLSKYLIESYDEKYTGRQITLDWAYVNPFTGFVHLSNVTIYESKKDSIFFSAKSVSADFALLSFLTKTFEITELTINHPHGIVIQKKKHFNFDDLIVRFSPDKSTVTKSHTHFNILRIRIEHGELFYKEKVIPINYAIKDLNMDCSGIRWNTDTISSDFSFLSQNEKGGIKGNFSINVVNQNYRLATTVRNFDLELIRQYLWELINYGMFSAQLDARIKARGNFKDPNNINLSGRFLLRNFHLGKSVGEDYVAFSRLLVVINKVSPLTKKFLFDSITLDKPFIKYEIYDSLDNVQRLLGKRGSNVSDVTSQADRFNLVIEIGRYLKRLTRNFFESNYQVNKLVVSRGDLKFSDFSLSEQFSIEMNALTIRADSVDKNNKRVAVYIRSGIKPFGNLSINLSINPKDSGDFDMGYHITKIPASLFNPYLISYTSFPLDRGTLELNGIWHVREGEIKSVNHLVAIDPRLAGRIRNKDLKWIPLPLIIAFVRERDNVIDYEIPISGNLKDPHFHLHDVITDLFKNIFIKPATIPYGVELKSTVVEIEDFVTLKWNMRQGILRPHQREFVSKMAKFLKKNPDASIKVYSNEYSVKEKEHILFFEAKKKYFLQKHRNTKFLSNNDSIHVERMSVKDAEFVHALKKGVSDTMFFSIQEKCFRFVGRKNVDLKYKQLLKERQEEFQSVFIKNETDGRVHFFSDTESVPYNGFSFFKVSYEGGVPKSLQKAYDKMTQFNEEAPRNTYFRKQANLDSMLR